MSLIELFNHYVACDGFGLTSLLPDCFLLISICMESLSLPLHFHPICVMKSKVCRWVLFFNLLRPLNIFHLEGLIHLHLKSLLKGQDLLLLCSLFSVCFVVLLFFSSVAFFVKWFFIVVYSASFLLILLSTILLRLPGNLHQAIDSCNSL